jgi:hypothetical protein
MRLARTAPLLLVLSLLTSTATASAECAWVLWAITSATSYDTMSAALAFDTKQTCELALTEQLTSWRTNTGLRATVSGSMVFVRTTNEDGSMFTRGTRYICLPDSVDPRGVTGAAR